MIASKSQDMPLVALRESRGLTLRQIAERVGTDDGAVSRWERGEAEPRAQYRGRYAAALGISLKRLGEIVYTSPVQVRGQRGSRVGGKA